MPNIAVVLKQEIARLARKEVRTEVEGLRKTVAQLRAELSQLKARAAAQDKVLARLQRQAGKGAAAAPSGPAGGPDQDDGQAAGGKRFSAKGLASNRARLGLSAAEYGRLIGVTGQSIYAWETGRSLPRARQLAAIAALRGIGKKEVRARLADAAAQAPEASA